jgi:hypothetical protein
MKCLNKRATAIFNKLIDGLTKVGDHKKISNNPSFMAVCVEMIGHSQVSIAHYYEQNGDLMRDPDVVFYIGIAGEVYPISFRQDGLGIDQEAAYIEDGKWLVKTKMQADITKFCNQWMVGIKEQQLCN